MPNTGHGRWTKGGGVYGANKNFIVAYSKPRLSKHRRTILEDAGVEVVEGACYNCGYPEALQKEGDKYPICRRCGFGWGREEDD